MKTHRINEIENGRYQFGFAQVVKLTVANIIAVIVITLL